MGKTNFDKACQSKEDMAKMMLAVHEVLNTPLVRFMLFLGVDAKKAIVDTLSRENQG